MFLELFDTVKKSMLSNDRKVPLTDTTIQKILQTSIEDKEFEGPFHSCSVAKLLCKLADESTVLNSIKMNKLVYLAHGWLLGLTGRPLIYEHVEVWKSGPVIPEMYFVIRSATERYMLIDMEKVRKKIEVFPNISSDSVEGIVISHVFNKYGAKTYTELTELTTTKNSPWNRAAFVCDDVIDDAITQDYYAAVFRMMAKDE